MLTNVVTQCQQMKPYYKVLAFFSPKVCLIFYNSIQISFSCLCFNFLNLKYDLKYVLERFSRFTNMYVCMYVDEIMNYNYCYGWFMRIDCPLWLCQ